MPDFLVVPAQILVRFDGTWFPACCISSGHGPGAASVALVSSFVFFHEPSRMGACRNLTPWNYKKTQRQRSSKSVSSLAEDWK